MNVINGQSLLIGFLLGIVIGYMLESIIALLHRTFDTFKVQILEVKNAYSTKPQYLVKVTRKFRYSKSKEIEFIGKEENLIESKEIAEKIAKIVELLEVHSKKFGYYLFIYSDKKYYVKNDIYREKISIDEAYYKYMSSLSYKEVQVVEELKNNKLISRGIKNLFKKKK